MKLSTFSLLLLASLSLAASCKKKSPQLPGEKSLFSDWTRSSNIDCSIETGATGDHYILETMAGGLGWIDYDADGDYDLYVTRGHENPKKAAISGRATNRLYQNDGSGRFVDVTSRAKVGEARYSFGVAVADYDGDGFEDLFVGNYGRSTLYHNSGNGTFEDVTEASGLAAQGWAMSAVWFDCDQDGDLDLYVARYLKYDPQTARPCSESGTKVYCHPRLFPGESDLLYENMGARGFRNVSRESGIDKSGQREGKGLGVIALDVNSDQKMDLYVANDTTPNYLWLNQGGGSFRDVAFDLDIAVDSSGQARASMGLDWADLDGNGLWTIHVTNFSRETNNLFTAGAGGRFIDEVQKRNLGHSYIKLGFGTLICDFNLDGQPDILVANGHVDDKVEVYSPRNDVKYRQTMDLFLGTKQGSFSRVPGGTKSYLTDLMIGRGLASADIDGDGDMDIAIATLDRGVVLLRNDSPAENRRVLLRLVGKGKMRSALGARVRVRIGQQQRSYEYQSARSYLAAVDPRISIALPEAKTIDSIHITWPDGQEQTLRNVQPPGIEFVIHQP